MKNWIRALLLAGVALIVGAWFVWSSSETVRESVEARAAEALGDVAAAGLRRQQSSGTERAADLISVPVEVQKIGDFIYQARGVANVQLIATDEGSVVFDTGLAIQAAKQARLLREAIPDQPTTHVVLSQSHQDHVGGLTFWEKDDPEIIAHREFPEEQRYLKQLEKYLWARNRTVFPWMPEEPPSLGLLEYGNAIPTRLVDDGAPYAFTQGGIRFQVLPTPGAEGVDNLSLWLPDQRILLTGDTLGPLFPQFPNVFTMRGEKVRKPVEYIHTLDALIALKPVLLIPSHNDPIEGEQEIRAGLTRIRDAVRYVHDATVRGMNEGKSVHELMNEITLPPELRLTQVHGRVSWAVKSIWEYYATWFHFDTATELYAVPASEVYGELTELAGAEALVQRARQHLEAGRPVHSLHLTDIVLGSNAAHAAALGARGDALRALLNDAENGLRNSYEIDYLKAQLQATTAALQPS